ncbi:uncharacterized protein LOC135815197 [Sycon ciliatum]|uniref:uncharacterized protein LOC135815197 n=1 Tax=Sycon ciliatum TaxID=27933 RepID=UPI0031F6DC9F
MEDVPCEKRLKRDLRRIVKQRLASPMVPKQESSQANQSTGVLLMSTLFEDSEMATSDDDMPQSQPADAEALMSSQSWLLNSGSFSVQLLANLDSSGVLAESSQPSSVSSSQATTPVSGSSQPPAVGTVFQASQDPRQVSSRRSSTNSSFSLSTFDLEQLLEDAQAASQSVSRQTYDADTVANNGSVSSNVPSTPGSTSQAEAQRAVGTGDLGALLQLQKERDEFLDDSDDDEILRELAEQDREESIAMSQIYRGDLHEGMPGSTGPTATEGHGSALDLGAPTLLGSVIGAQPLTPSSEVPAQMFNSSFNELPPCNASTPVGRTHSARRKAKRVPAAGESAASTALDTTLPIDDGQMESQDAECSEFVLEADGSHSASDDGTIVMAGNGDKTNDENLEAILFSSRVSKNLSNTAKRLKKPAKCLRGDSFPKASLLHFKHQVESTELADAELDKPFSREATDVFASLDFPQRDPTSEIVEKPVCAAMDRLDAFALEPILAGSDEMVGDCCDSDLLPGMSPEYPAPIEQHVKKDASLSVIELSSSSETEEMEARGSPGSQNNTLVQEEQCDDDVALSDASDYPAEAARIETWTPVVLGETAYMTPTCNPPTRQDIIASAPSHNLPLCTKQDAEFSSVSDYTGPKTVGLTRVCVSAPCALGIEPFNTRKITSTKKSWFSLSTWRARINRNNFVYSHFGAKIELSSVNIQNADSLAQCAEERAKLLPPRSCWLTPTTKPPSRKAVIAWSRKQRSAQKPQPVAPIAVASVESKTPGKDPAESEKTESSVDSANTTESSMCQDGEAPSPNANITKTLSTSSHASAGSNSGSELDSSFMVPTQILPSADHITEYQSCLPPMSSESSRTASDSDSHLTAAQRGCFLVSESSVFRDSQSPTQTTSVSTEGCAGKGESSIPSASCDTAEDRHTVMATEDEKMESGEDRDCGSLNSMATVSQSKSSTLRPDVCNEQEEPSDMPSSGASSATPSQQRQSSISSDGLDDSALIAMLDATESELEKNNQSAFSDVQGSQSTAVGSPEPGDELTWHTGSLHTGTDASGAPSDQHNPLASEDQETLRRASLTAEQISHTIINTVSNVSIVSSGEVECSAGADKMPSSLEVDCHTSTTASPVTPAPRSALRSSGNRSMVKRVSSSVSFSLAPDEIVTPVDSNVAEQDTDPSPPPAAERPNLLLFKGKSSPSSRVFTRTPLAKRRRSSGLKSQIDGPTLANEHGFEVSMLDLGEAHSVHESQHLTLLDVEVHVRSRGSLMPDPDQDMVCALFYMIDQELGGGRCETTTGVLMVDSTPDPVPLSRYAVTIGQHQLVRDEADLFAKLVLLVEKYDPDLLLGFEVQKRSWGYLLQRATALHIPLLTQLSRITETKEAKAAPPQADDSEHPSNAYNARKMTELRIPGRIILNVWRLMRHEAALTSYTLPSVAFHILHVRIADFTHSQLTRWFDQGSVMQRSYVLEFYMQRCHYTMQLLRRLDLVARTSEMARLFGLQFYEVLTRGSQFRVESMMLRLTKAANYVAVSPSVQQRAKMNAPECVPLILEPESRFYSDPVIVLDFQSLYPSMMIAHNYCYSTCLGRLAQYSDDGVDRIKFGCSTLEVTADMLKELEDDVSISPNGIVFVKEHVRRGILPQMLDEILSTRIMVKKAMKQCKADKSVHRMLDHRQLGLKLIANVTYGYTNANFSGRMPCIEVADSIVRKGRETLERAIQLVRSTSKWGGRVVYGDTDSMFIQVPGVSKERAFEIGKEIVDAVTADNPKPVKLKFEKVYYPCVLQTKKRYCGYKYETLDQKEPEFEAKGIETVRRDGCPAVVKVLGRSLKLLFSTRDVSRCKQFIQQQCVKLLQGKVNLQDLIIAKEYRGMATYQPTACVPCLEITRRLLSVDRRAEPLVAERVPYVVVCGTPGQPLIQLVRRPAEVLEDSSCRLNAVYYITKQLLPPLNRVFHLLGVDVFSWYSEMPHVVRLNAMFLSTAVTAKGNLAEFFSSLHCPICQAMTRRGVCTKCRDNREQTVAILAQRLNRLESSLSRLEEICKSCCRRQHHTSACSSLDCPVFYRRHQTSAALQIAAPLRDTFLLAPYAMQDGAYGLALPALPGNPGDMQQASGNDSVLSCDMLDSSGIFLSSGEDSESGVE